VTYWPRNADHLEPYFSDEGIELLQIARLQILWKHWATPISIIQDNLPEEHT